MDFRAEMNPLTFEITLARQQPSVPGIPQEVVVYAADRRSSCTAAHCCHVPGLVMAAADDPVL